MKLGKTTSLAVLATCYLSQQGGRTVRARTVAAALNIPTDSALKILQSLARAQIITSQLGRSGGYRLTRRADDISLLEIIHAIDGPTTNDLPLDAPDCAAAAEAMQQLQSCCEDMTERMQALASNCRVSDLNRRRVGDGQCDEPREVLQQSA